MLSFVINSYGQTYPVLERALAKQHPEKSNVDGRWVFYSDKAEIKKIHKPLVKAVIPNFDFYEVSLTDFWGIMSLWGVRDFV